MAEVQDVRRSQRQSSRERLRDQIRQTIERQRERESNQVRRVGVQRPNAREDATVRENQRTERQQDARRPNQPLGGQDSTERNRIDILA